MSFQLQRYRRSELELKTGGDIDTSPPKSKGEINDNTTW